MYLCVYGCLYMRANFNVNIRLKNVQYVFFLFVCMCVLTHVCKNALTSFQVSRIYMPLKHMMYVCMHIFSALSRLLAYVYMCMCNRGESCPQATIDELHEKVLQEIQRIFNQYKKAAGQPDAVLEVV